MVDVNATLQYTISGTPTDVEGATDTDSPTGESLPVLDGKARAELVTTVTQLIALNESFNEAWSPSSPAADATVEGVAGSQTLVAPTTGQRLSLTFARVKPHPANTGLFQWQLVLSGPLGERLIAGETHDSNDAPFQIDDTVAGLENESLLFRVVSALPADSMSVNVLYRGVGLSPPSSGGPQIIEAAMARQGEADPLDPPMIFTPALDSGVQILSAALVDAAAGVLEPVTLAQGASTLTFRAAAAAMSPFAQFSAQGTKFAAVAVADTAVGTFHDEIGTRHLTQATGTRQPIYRASVAAFNNKPAIQFDGVDDAMATAAWTAMAQPNTVVVVGKFTVAGAQNAYLTDGIGSSNRHALFAPGTNEHSITAGTVLTTTGQAVTTAVRVFVATFSGTDTLHINNVSVLSGSGGTNSLTGLTVGARFSLANFFNGYIAEVVVFDGALTTQQMTDLWTAAQTEYAL